MKPVQIVVAILIGWAVSGSARPADAQDRTYTPRRPTLSQYHHLFRADPGPLGQYHTYVRPRLEARRAMAQQDARLRRQEAATLTLRDELGRRLG